MIARITFRPTCLVGLVFTALAGCGLADSRDPKPLGESVVGATINAETFSPERSVGIEVVTSEADSERTYVGYFDSGKSMCYENVDLTGVASLELVYAKSGDPGRFAVLAYRDGHPPVNLGEKTTAETGGWESFQALRVGLSESLAGPHWLCIVGLQGGGILNLDRFTLSAESGDSDGVTRHFKVVDGVLSYRVPGGVVSAGGHHFRLEAVADLPGLLWSMDFLPEGGMGASQLDGNKVFEELLK